MPNPRAFIAFDYDHDEFLRAALIGQSKHPDTDFEIADWSVKLPFTGDWQAKVRDRIRPVDQVIVICGEHTDGKMLPPPPDFDLARPRPPARWGRECRKSLPTRFWQVQTSFLGELLLLPEDAIQLEAQGLSQGAILKPPRRYEIGVASLHPSRLTQIIMLEHSLK